MKLPAWRTAQLERKGPRPNRHTHDTAWVLMQLRNGATLYSGREKQKRWWMLNDGNLIHGTTAKRVIADPHVVSGGDSLFESVLAQTFRYIENDHEI
jgi:hypothetical protein